MPNKVIMQKGQNFVANESLLRLINWLMYIVLGAAMTFGVLSCSSSKKPQKEEVSLANLRCEMLTNPEGIDVTEPRLSWELQSGQRNIKQTAYQVKVASSKEQLASGEADLWNSGKVSSGASIHVKYQGETLETRDECYWQVKVWSENGESDWSEPAYWSMGMLNYNDWWGRWIGFDQTFSWDSETKFSQLSARHYRKEFEAKDSIKQAKIYIVGLGMYELFINGEQIGDQVLAPLPTDYTESAFYNTFDITEQIKAGKNAIGTLLGNGRYYTMRQNYKPYKIKTFGYPKMLIQLEIQYEDGSRQVVKTDDTWKGTADGPIRSNNEYDGEIYDARKEMPGWGKVGFDDSNWLQAEYVQPPRGFSDAQMSEPMKVMETIEPVSISKLKPNTYIMDMGQNMVGWVKMKVNGQRGHQVKLRFAETIKENGELFMANLRDAKVTDLYTLKGGGEEAWEPTFVYHGFRYVEITNYPGTPTIDDFEGKVVYDAMATTGSFETSNQTINQVYKNAYWGIRGNYKGMPVDCPQRNERQPWLGDRAMGSYGESFIFDNVKLYAKWLDDIEQSQKDDGCLSDVAPAYWRYYSDNMTWPGAYILIANMLYNQFGNREPIEAHYASMKKWLKYMEGRYMEDYIMTEDSYGDWCVPPETKQIIHTKAKDRLTDGHLIATAYHYHLMDLMKRFAGMLDKPEDIKAYEALMPKVKDAFNAKFFEQDSMHYDNCSATANLLPLAFGMVPEAHFDKVFQSLVDEIMIDNDGHISTGIIGAQWLMRELTKNGRADIAYKIATNRDYPSWGYMVESGATTIWELWNGNTAAPWMNSRNHVMLLGDLVVWYYENLAGIKTSPAAPGFKRMIMKPSFIDDLDYVKASYQSMHGNIKSHWQKDGEKLTWNITIPANTSAEVYLPASAKGDVMEGGQKAGTAYGVKFLRMEDGKAVFEVGSGDYTFSTTVSNG